MSSPSPLDCSIEASLTIIGERWTLLVLRESFRGVRRFDNFCNELGIARNLLTDRLNKLVEHEVLEKHKYQDRPSRYEYRLTPKGADLSAALIALMHWGDKYLAGGAGAPLVLTHGRCDEPIDQLLVCASCGESVSPGAIRSRPGPGAHSVPV